MSRRGALALGLLVAALLTAGTAIGVAASLNLASQALTPYRTCTITATPASTTTVTDASVRQATATTNFGTVTTNNIASAAAANRRLYLRFDLAACSPAIPTSAIVRLATLRLYVTAVPATCRTVDLFRVAAAWTEAGITWTNQPFGATINNPLSGTATDSFTIGTGAGCQNTATSTYITGVNPTTDVAAFVAGTATNNGWMLRDDVEGAVTIATQTYSAKDLGTLAQAPQLLVTYVAVP